MKIRAYKKTALKACRLLTEDIYKIMPNADFSLVSNRYRAEAALKQVIGERYRIEPQVKEWSYKFDILYVPEHNSSISLHVVIQEDWERENLLYLDFDK
ncbi:hypothetical protein EBU71_10365 [bacterium]|jgi:hypothetical protein|nr:hypothetical protein [Candidatus Elulimicrobium humile]